MGLVYKLARIGFARPMISGMRIRTEGAEKIPDGGALLVCNHACDADPAVLMKALPCPVGFLGASFMGKLPIFRTLMRWAGSVAIGAEKPRPWKQQVRERLQNHAAFVVFPEGQSWLLAQDFEAPVADFHPGFASFAYDAGVPVVPMVIDPHVVTIKPFKISPIARRLSDNPSELAATRKVMHYKDCSVRVLEPIETGKFSGLPKNEAVPWLVTEARNRMQSALADRNPVFE